MPKFDFSAVGFLVLDVLCRGADEMPPAGGALFVDQIHMTVAGTAGGTAVDCALLGLNGQIVARVGKDDMGDFLVSRMSRFGLDVGQIQRDPSLQTSTSMLPIDSDGVRRAFFAPGASRTFTLDERQMEAALDAQIIHLGGTGLLDSFDGTPSLELLKRAKEHGRTTVFDLILADANTIEKVAPLLPHIDYFVPSIVEASAMAGIEGPGDVARWFKDRGVRNAVLTLEDKGVFVDPHEGGAFHCPAHAIDVVDTTGCGDSFTAGIITGIAKGWDIRRSARFANAVAALVAGGLGSQGTLESFDMALQAMENLPLKT
ncbi:carbohydrate kinase family protein [Hoeflea sp.]|uniref:carbohydrate kinase family protein n=1 Tax=Hoeflea sp. TaxID=1940281 RepID=UPI003B01580D